MHLRWRAVQIILCMLVALCLASQGDRAPSYERCLSEGLARSIARPPVFWTRQSDCSYRCQQSLTDLALRAEPAAALLLPGGDLEGLELGRMVQFHGKWPFKRLWFVQEPLSVLFSLGNLWAHYRGFLLLSQSRVRTDKASVFDALYKLNAVVAINSWLWSAVFHSRDIDWTEKADYFSAGGAILYGLYVALCRTTILETPTATSSRRILALMCIIAFVGHCAYLTFGRFDYGYNITANATVGFVQLALWLAWCARAYFVSASTGNKDARARAKWRYARRALPSLVGLVLATSLELLDFEPVPKRWRLLDAHAAWHAATIPVCVLWYRFLRKDMDVLNADDESSVRADKDKRVVWL